MPASQCNAWTKCQSPSHQPRPAAKPRESNRPRQLRDLQDPEQRTMQIWRSTPRAPRVRSRTSQSRSRQPSVRVLRGERSDPHFLWGLNASADRITSAQPPSSPSMLTRWLESRKEGLGATWRSTDYLEGRLPWMDRPRFRPPHRHGQERRQYLKQMKLSDQFACDGA